MTQFDGSHSAQRPRLYGRSKGRPLRDHQLALMDELYPHLELTPPVSQHLDPNADLWFEIGFGGGEHLLAQAQTHPHVQVWGAEPFVNGVAKTLAGIEAQNLSNIRLLCGDGRDVMDGLPDGALAKLFVLFPDPWPKSRHKKRRIISEAFLNDVHRVLRQGGILRFGSDIIDYVDWTLTRIHAHGGFKWEPRSASDWLTRPADWVETRYQQKAIREGRICHYFEFVRN